MSATYIAVTRVCVSKMAQSSTIVRLHRFARKEMRHAVTIAVILIVLWLLGLVTSHTMGGVIHVLLVIAVVIILIQVIQGRRG